MSRNRTAICKRGNAGPVCAAARLRDKTSRFHKLEKYVLKKETTADIMGSASRHG